MIFKPGTFDFARGLSVMLLGGMLIAVCCSAAVGDENDKVDFRTQIWPILQERCQDCHNADTQEGQLRLDAREAFLAGGVSGVLTGKTSLLMDRIEGKGDLPQMPLDEEPLSAKQIKLIRQWVEQGAVWPREVGERSAIPKRHWAYQSPVRPPLPKSRLDDWCQNPIDRFVAHRMQGRNLSPSAPAHRGKLLRRVYLDVIGLPPTPEELKSFQNDDSPDAFERVVDELLSRPQFGEKWSRPWLDLARYADTNGFQADQFRSVWPYRDWVIESMNHDQPFDQFTIEQLAGDLIPNATIDQKVATGFHRLTTCNVEAGVDPEENRVNQIIDRVNTTGTVWFGTTFECMQCHNHKYDPFTQREYYQIFAYFNNTPLEVKNSGNNIQYEFFGPKMELPLSQDQRKLLESYRVELDRTESKLEALRKERKPSFKAWLTKGANRDKGRWVPLRVKQFTSDAGSPHKILGDQSILLSGKVPDKDVYTVICESDVTEIRGFKIETLTDDSLPNRGPGRHGDGRPNFVLNEFTASEFGSGDETRQWKKILLIEPIADFSQRNFSAGGLIDDDPATAWAINPQFGKPHWASVLTTRPVKRPGRLDGGSKQPLTRLRFKLVQSHGGGRTIGRLRISALIGERPESELPKDIQKIITLAEKKRTAAQTRKLLEYFYQLDGDYQTLISRRAELKKKLEGIQGETTLVMTESKKRQSFVFKRGNFLDEGSPVTTATPAVLHQGKTGPGQNRLDFARWIFREDNPLTARVVVNRWWMEIFGVGLVGTAEDFGTQGNLPSHPELLDWLAVEFMKSGWSRKHILRLIVTSATYQQTSAIDATRLAIDPGNQFYSRGPRFRMPAEMIRDNGLKIADVYATKMAGPPVFPPQPDGIWRHVGRNAPKYETSTDDDRYRRGIYVFWRRSAPYPSFVNFDAPDRTSCIVNRPKTNTPLQALTLLNDEAYLELTRAFAKRIRYRSATQKSDDRTRLKQAFLSCTCRQPNSVEIQFLVDFLDRQRDAMKSKPKQAKQLAGISDDSKSTELAAWVAVAQVLLNLDETITKD